MSSPQRPSTFRKSQAERTFDVPYEETYVPLAVEYPPEQATYEILADEIDPPTGKPVFLTEAPPTVHTLRTWAALTVNVDSIGSELAGDVWQNRRMVVRNTDAASDVFLVPSVTTPTYLGFKLTIGKTLEMTNTRRVIAKTDTAGTTCEVTAIVELDIPPGDKP